MNCFVTSCDLNSAKVCPCWNWNRRSMSTARALHAFVVYLVSSLRFGPMTFPTHFRVLGLIQPNHIETENYDCVSLCHISLLYAWFNSFTLNIYKRLYLSMHVITICYKNNCGQTLLLSTYNLHEYFTKIYILLDYI